MCEWQPIDTAPKDKTMIDVWEFCHDPKWRDEHGIASGMRVANVCWHEGEWVTWDDRIDDAVPLGPAEHYTVSHWMPLPAPPSA